MLASLKNNRVNIILLSLVVAICLASAFFIVQGGLLLPISLIAIAFLVAIQIMFAQNQKSIVWVMLAYAFTLFLFDREVSHFQWGMLQEGIMVLGFITIIFTARRYDWKSLGNNDVFIWLTVWLFISVAEIANPAGASVQGWLLEVRSAALYPFIVFAIGFLLLKKNADLNTFFYIVLGFSVLAALNGMKQLYIGPSPGEQKFLDDGGAITHLLWGKLRVFSFYSDAGQFGASQAHITLMAFILAMGPFKWWKKLLLFGIGLITFYGMLISGTRGALVGLVAGAFLALLISKNFKAVLVGGIILCIFLGGLKYTTLGNNVYQIYRLRSALDPQEASLNVRLNNQALLREYLATRPLGGGLGTMGDAGSKYNTGTFLATIPPDSYWVKVWGMYGIVGFTIWICIMMYILGKCCGIIWNIKNPGLKVKLIALASGYCGILMCSYGNEVINTSPSSYIVYISWVLIFIGPRLDKELAETNILKSPQNAI